MSDDFFPVNDGVDHINIYSKGTTELGRLLSNFAHTPFTCEHGAFASVEAYWYWLRSPKAGINNLAKLRTLHGFAAKKFGRTLVAPDADQIYVGDDFEALIKDAFREKLIAHPHIQIMLRDSALPLAHYYVFKGAPKAAGHEWQVEYWEELRKRLQRYSGTSVA